LKKNFVKIKIPTTTVSAIDKKDDQLFHYAIIFNNANDNLEEKNDSNFVKK